MGKINAVIMRYIAGRLVLRRPKSVLQRLIPVSVWWQSGDDLAKRLKIPIIYRNIMNSLVATAGLYREMSGTSLLQQAPCRSAPKV